MREKIKPQLLTDFPRLLGTIKYFLRADALLFLVLLQVVQQFPFSFEFDELLLEVSSVLQLLPVCHVSRSRNTLTIAFLLVLAPLSNELIEYTIDSHNTTNTLCS